MSASHKTDSSIQDSDSGDTSPETGSATNNNTVNEVTAHFEQLIELGTLYLDLMSHLDIRHCAGGKYKLTSTGCAIFSSQEESKEECVCSICFVNFGDGDRIRDLRCKHRFHQKCIDKWLKINPTCGMCRADMTHLCV